MTSALLSDTPPSTLKKSLLVLLPWKRQVKYKIDSSSKGFAITQTIYLCLKGDPFTDAAVEKCKAADAILLGAVGGLPGAKIGSGPRPEQGLLKLRKALDLYANLRPVSIPSESLISLSPLKDHVVDGTDFVFVRELVGGIYFGDRKEAGEDGKGNIELLTRVSPLIAVHANFL